MSKPKILVCVLTGLERHGWVNPWLTQNLLTMSHDSRFDVQIELVIGKHPVDYARNCCVVMARERKADYLLMVDNDQHFEISPLDTLSTGIGKDVIGLPSMQGYNPDAVLTGADPLLPNFRTLDRSESDGEFFTVEKIGTGAMFIRRTVWETIPGPWFKWCYDESGELHAVAGGDSPGEDFYFCELARSKGFKVWAHRRLIMHWKTAEVSRLGTYLQLAKQMAAQSGVPVPQVKWNVRR